MCRRRRHGPTPVFTGVTAAVSRVIDAAWGSHLPALPIPPVLSCRLSLPDSDPGQDSGHRHCRAIGLFRPDFHEQPDRKIGPLRPPGRDAVRLAADQLLARQAAFQPQRVARAKVLGKAVLIRLLLGRDQDQELSRRGGASHLSLLVQRNLAQRKHTRACAPGAAHRVRGAGGNFSRGHPDPARHPCAAPLRGFARRLRRYGGAPQINSNGKSQQRDFGLF